MYNYFKDFEPFIYVTVGICGFLMLGIKTSTWNPIFVVIAAIASLLMMAGSLTGLVFWYAIMEHESSVDNKEVRSK